MDLCQCTDDLGGNRLDSQDRVGSERLTDVMYFLYDKLPSGWYPGAPRILFIRLKQIRWVVVRGFQG